MQITTKSNYRFISPYTIFQRCVDITKALLAKEQLILLFGCTKKVKFNLYLSKKQFCEEYKDISFEEYKNILFEEIAFIIEQNIIMPGIEEASLPESLKEVGFNDSEIKIMVQEKVDKRNYVKENLAFDNATLRYLFKQSTMENKLSSIKYEINKYVFEDKKELCYAVIEFASADRLNAERFSLLSGDARAVQKSKFVCDKQDLDYIINQLQQIKENL